MTNLSCFNKSKVLVIGDVMLDRYVTGKVERISPEAPVPIIHQQSLFLRAGGAGNVACNVTSLGATATLISTIGEDTYADELKKIMETEKVRYKFITIEGRCTTSKTRLMSGNHQIARLDLELVEDLSGSDSEKVVAAFKGEITTHDIVVLSDYGKGLLHADTIRSIISIANAYRIPVIVDPKKSDLRIYHGATVITPNRKELSLATGYDCETDTGAEQACTAAVDLTEASILLTRSEQGMTLMDKSRSVLHLATRALQVFDVSGAGDTVVATLAVSLGAGNDLVESSKTANAAAGIVVAKLGTALVTIDELNEKMFPPHDSSSDLELDELVGLRESWKRAGLQVGFTNGCFDLLHPGHVSLLEFAKSQCDRLIVGLNADVSVKKLKGSSRPIQNEASRRRVLAALRSVDAVMVFGEETPDRLIKIILPDVLVKGADYQERTVVGADTVLAVGGRVILAPLIEGQSTSKIASRIKNDDQI